MQIDLSSIDEKLFAAVRAIAETVRAAGGRALMVGGAVRDLMRGEKVKDIDLEVFGIGPENLKEVLSENLPTKVVRIGMVDSFGQSGTPKELLKYYGIDAEGIVNRILDIK